MCTDCPRRLADDLEAAFPEFLAHHQDLVYGIALRSTKRPADADDLAQEAFVRAYRALRDYHPARIRALRPKGWLAAIVGNLGRNRARRKAPPTADLEAVADVRADEAPGPEGLVERRESAAAWRARLDALPTRYRRAVELRHVGGLSYPELAEALGRPLGTAKSDVHRGVRLLREVYEDEMNDDSHEVA
ncbi:MAG: sigma-70 family RNA polymerase sigma factor [Candidatus Limnocylindrales bacterium]